MAEPVRARQLSDEEGRRLPQIVRRGRKRPVRLPATYHRTHGVRYFHGCCSVGGDQLWAGGRTGGHGVIGAQTGGRGTGKPARAAARDFTGAIGPLGGDGNRM